MGYAIEARFLYLCLYQRPAGRQRRAWSNFNFLKISSICEICGFSFPFEETAIRLILRNLVNPAWNGALGMNASKAALSPKMTRARIQWIRALMVAILPISAF